MNDATLDDVDRRAAVLQLKGVLERARVHHRGDDPEVALDPRS